MSNSNAEENVLNMSDEEFEKQPLPEYTEPDEDQEVVESEEEVEVVEEDESTEETTDEVDANEEVLPDSEEEEEEEEVVENQQVPDDSESDQNLEDKEKTTETDESKPDDKPTDEDKPEEENKDVESKDSTDNWSELSKPFKANGKMMTVTNVDDARTLMQLGANYTKKMKALQPNLKILKMLENNSLLDENKLTYLIDLDKKDPDAVNKLIKDSGIDPLDINKDAEVTYKPNNYSVGDNEVIMDQVLEEVEQTEHYDTTYDVITNQLDKASKQALVNDPTLIRELNNDVGAGIYDGIMEIVNHEQALGRLTNMSDLAAYKYVGDKLREAGAFDEPTPPAEEQVQPKIDTSKKTEEQVAAEEAKRIAKRKAAGSTSSNTKTVKTKTADFNPLSMSDEEFEKEIGNAIY